jgi:hypothetical protein
MSKSKKDTAYRWYCYRIPKLNNLLLRETLSYDKRQAGIRLYNQFRYTYDEMKLETKLVVINIYEENIELVQDVKNAELPDVPI